MLGKRAPLSDLKQQVGGLGPDERKHVGLALNQAKAAIDDSGRRAPVRARGRGAARPAGGRPARSHRARAGGPARAPAPRDPDPRSPRGRVRGHGLHGRRGSRGRERLVQLRGAQHARAPTRRGACTTRSTSTSASPRASLLRTHTSPVQIRVMQYQAAARVLGHARSGVPAATPPTPATCPSSTRSRGSSSTAASPSATWPAPSTPSPRPTSAGRSTRGCARRYFPFTEPSAEYDINCLFCEGRAAAPAGRPDGSSSAAAAWCTPTCFAAVGVRPRAVVGLRVRVRHRPVVVDALRHRRHPRPVQQRRPLPEPVLMTVLLSWLREFAPIEGDPVALGEQMSDLGMAVESIEHLGEGLDGRRRGPGARPAAAPAAPIASSSSTSTPATARRCRSVVARSTWRWAISSRSPRSARSCPTA